MPAAGLVCGQEKGPEWCTDAVRARGMCRRHYRRLARGLPLDPDDGRQVGVTPSGHGTWGVLTEENGRVLCHECGRRYAALGKHVADMHDGGRAYRLEHGLPLSLSLSSADLREQNRARALERNLVQFIEDVRTPETLAAVDDQVITRGRRLSWARRRS